MTTRKGIFLDPRFGRVTYNLANQAVDVPTKDGSRVLYYGKDCLLSPDYDSENAIRSELANVIKAAGLKYDPNALDNLVRAIIQLIAIWGYTPDKTYDIEIPEHNVCNTTAEIVLTERLTKDGKIVNRLTRIPLDRLLKDLGKEFDITKIFDSSLISGDINIDDKVVLERVTVKDGGVQSRLVTLPIQELVKKYAPYKDLSKPFPENIQDKQSADTIQLIGVKDVANGEHQLVKTNIKDLFHGQPFDPSQAFDKDLINHFDPKMSVVMEGDIEGNQKLFYKNSLESLAKWLVGPIASSYIKQSLFRNQSVLGTNKDFRANNGVTKADTKFLRESPMSLPKLESWKTFWVADDTLFFPESRNYYYTYHLALSPSLANDTGGDHAVRTFLIASDDKGNYNESAKPIPLPWDVIVGTVSENALTYATYGVSISSGYYRCITVYLFATENPEGMSAVIGLPPPDDTQEYPRHPRSSLLGVDFYNNFAYSKNLER